MPMDKASISDRRFQAGFLLLGFGARVLGLAAVWFTCLAWFQMCFVWLLNLPAPGFFSLSAPWLALYLVGLYLILWVEMTRFARQHDLPWSPLHVGPLLLGPLSVWLLLNGINGVFWGLGWLQFSTLKVDWPLILGQSLLLGLGVAWIEERLFRDLMLTWFCRVYSYLGALCLQALLFSLAHQLRGNWPLEQRLLSAGGLFLVALFLGQIRGRYGWAWAVGLHAGWVAYCSFVVQSQIWILEPGTRFWHGAGNPVESGLGLLLFGGLNLLWIGGRAGLKSETESGLCSDTLQKPVS